MQYYPLFIDLTKISCLVLGAGCVGRRKIASLQKAGAKSILVLDEFLEKEVFFDAYNMDFPEFKGTYGAIVFEKRSFVEEDLRGVRLAFAATSDHEQNGMLAHICEQNNVFCNVIEGVERGDFIVPAQVDCENITLALSSSGASPALTKALKDELHNWLQGEGYGVYYTFMEEVRRILVKENTLSFDTETRTKIFRALVQKTARTHILSLLLLKNRAELEKALQACLTDITGTEQVAQLCANMDFEGLFM